MMNIFNSLKSYAGKWSEKSRRPFNDEEKNAVVMAVVIESTYDRSVQFQMKNGSLTFIPLAKDSPRGVGEIIDLNEAELVTLCKSGEPDIVRVYAK